jgi:hypothetical protein
MPENMAVTRIITVGTSFGPSPFVLRCPLGEGLALTLNQRQRHVLIPLS